MGILTGHVVERIRSATKSHDEAIHNWAISTRTDRNIEAQLIQSLYDFHKACCGTRSPHDDQQHDGVNGLLPRDGAPHLVGAASGQRLRRTSLTLSVDVQPAQRAMDCYSRAFLLSTIDMDPRGKAAAVVSGGVGGSLSSTMESENLTLMAAIMFYNIGLFYHIRLQDMLVVPITSSPQRQQRQQLCPGTRVADLDCWAVRQYYEKANGLLATYLNDTREPLWTFQAAVWHNLADSYRYRIGNDPVAWIYFEQLESIRGWVDDKSDRLFFERAIAMARMQRNACLSATAA
jgi:hypothetical protein